MKELTIKEKAEAYDYAVNKAKELILNENGVVRVDKPLFDELFPSEMEESEDERIRKKLIEAVKRDMVVGGTKDKQLAIAWLEKQGEKEKFIKKELDCIRGYRDEAIRRLNELEKQGEHKHQYKSRPRYVGEEELLGVNKQGEQKPVDVKPHLPDGNIPYDRGFEEAQEYIFHRGFDIPWNDCDVFVDERYITQTVANVLTWADDHPKYGEQKPEMIQWTGNNLREVADFTGVHPNLRS